MIVNKRMKMAFGEIKHYNDYKYILINDNFNDTLKKILSIIKMERNQRIDILKINKKFNIN